MYIHNGGDCSLKTICAKTNAPLTSIDLSTDSSHFQAATSTNELHFYSIADGTKVASPAVTRDKKWATITVPLGWHVQGCWSSVLGEKSSLDNEGGFAPYVVSVHRSPNNRYLAKGCIDGTVAVYNYPTHAPGMSMLKVPGHASSISKVRFTSDCKHLLALGQFNRTITQYSLTQGDH